MFELVTSFQATIFEMNINELLSDREFAILEALSECMKTNSDALELATTLTMEDLKDASVVDHIIERSFKDVYVAKICPWDVVP